MEVIYFADIIYVFMYVIPEETSMVNSSAEALPSHWCEHEIARHKRKKLKLQTHRK